MSSQTLPDTVTVRASRSISKSQRMTFYRLLLPAVAYTAATAKRILYSGQQFAWFKRFGQVVVSANLKADDAVRIGCRWR